MKLDERACPVCGSRDRSSIVFQARYDEVGLREFAFASRKTPEFMHFRMVRCSVCDLVYANPAPDPDWLWEQYEDAAFDAADESRHAARTYARLLKEIRSRLPDREAALDIGAGDGAFLEQLVEVGFSRVEGVEPSRAPVLQAKPEIRRLIREGFFDGKDYEANSFSLVTCFQALEHLEDPRNVCAEAYRILEPGGVFCGATHNHRALSARILGARSPIYDIEHLQLFSPRSLVFMLSHIGFERIVIKPLCNAYPLAYWVKLLPLPLRLKRALTGGLESLGLAGRVVHLWAGNLAVTASKAEA